MNDDNAARNAIEGLNDKEHAGRKLIVNEARPREDGGGGGRGREVLRNGRGKAASGRRLYAHAYS